MIKVLQVYRTFFPDTQGGLEEVIRQIAINVTSSQVRVFSISRNISEPDKVDVDGITVYRVPLSFELASCSFAFRGLEVYRELVDWADIINYHFPWPFGDLLHLLYGKNKKTVVTYHSDIVRQKWLLRLYRPIKRRFLSSVDRIVATSPNYFQTSDILQKYNQKVDIIPIGLDEKNYPAVDNEKKNKWSEIINGPFFLFIGVLGGFTTFSTFGNESFLLIKKEEIFLAMLYLCFTLIGGRYFKHSTRSHGDRSAACCNASWG